MGLTGIYQRIERIFGLWDFTENFTQLRSQKFAWGWCSWTILAEKPY